MYDTNGLREVTSGKVDVTKTFPYVTSHHNVHNIMILQTNQHSFS